MIRIEAEMKKYRKKPVVIEAVPVPSKAEECYAIRDNLRAQGADIDLCQDQQGMAIKTLEGTMIASCGDYIIKGIQGEFYPCKPDIFEATYDEVKND